MVTRRRRHRLKGFTIAELLVVLLILGILALIFLPSFLNQQACAHVGSEPEQYVGSLVRSQQAFFLEESRFAKSIAGLNSPVPSKTKFYDYSTETDTTNVLVYGRTKHTRMKNYVAGVFLREIKKNELITEAIICVAKQPGIGPIAPPINAQTCSEGTIKLPRC